jgi:hypothetical protein
MDFPNHRKPQTRHPLGTWRLASPITQTFGFRVGDTVCIDEDLPNSSRFVDEVEVGEAKVIGAFRVAIQIGTSTRKLCRLADRRVPHGWRAW